MTHKKLALPTTRSRFNRISFRCFPTGLFTLDTLLFPLHNIFSEVPHKFLSSFLALRSKCCDRRLPTRTVSKEPCGQLQTKIKARFSLRTQSGTHVGIKKRIKNRNIENLPKIYLCQWVKERLKSEAKRRRDERSDATPPMCSLNDARLMKATHFSFFLSVRKSRTWSAYGSQFVKRTDTSRLSCYFVKTMIFRLQTTARGGIFDDNIFGHFRSLFLRFLRHLHFLNQ